MKLCISKGIAGPYRRLRVFAAKACKCLIHLSAMAACAMLTAVPAFAAEGDGNTGGTSTGTGVGAGSDIWVWLDYALSDLYQKFLSVSTIAACVAASVCLILMNFSTDDRAVASSRAWLKRILLSWVILNVLGFIMTYLVNLTQGGSYTG